VLLGRRARGMELGLLVLAVLISGIGQVAQSIGRSNALDPGVWRSSVALLLLALAGHGAVRVWAPAADPVLLPLAVMLCGLGLAEIARIDGSPQGGSYAPRQLVWVALGVGAFAVTLWRLPDHRALASYGYTCGLAGLVLLALPAVLPASISEVNGARAWIRISGFSIQPGEIAKLLLMVFFASYLVAKRETLSVVNRSVLGLPLPRARDLGPVLVAWAASMVILVTENEIGFPLILFGLFLAMLFVATQRFSWVLIGLVLFAAGVAGADATVGHVHQRFVIWLDAFNPAYVSGSSYQLVQGLYAMAGGGLFGTGLGRGHPDLVPFARTDFVVAAIGEELGLVGLFVVLTLYAVLVARGLSAGLRVRDSFGKLFAAGLSVSLVIQVFVVVGGVTRLIPLTGITTPFVSYGGSSVIANFVVVALLLRISTAARSPAPPLAALPEPGATRLVQLPGPR